MTVLVTGAAGFIGFHVAEALLARGEAVVGLDNLSPYYDVTLKQARLDQLKRHAKFAFVKADIADHSAVAAALAPFGPVPQIVHMAAQAGVRYSLQAPFTYASSNVVGHLTILDSYLPASCTSMNCSRSGA